MEKRSICKELRSLNNVLTRRIEKELPHGCDKITVNNSWILGYLAVNRDRDVFGRDLEETFSVTRSTVSKVVEIMEGKGLIRRESVSYDARLKKLVLTEKADKLVKEMAQRGAEFEKLVMRGFTEEEKQQVFSFIVRMKLNVDNACEKE